MEEKEAEEVGEDVTTAVAATVTTAAVASVAVTATIATASAGAAGSGAAAGAGGGGGGAAVNMVMQVQSLAILGKLTSMEESSPTFSSFAGPMGMFNLEMSPPWSSSSSGRRLSERSVEERDSEALESFAGHAFYIFLILALVSPLHLAGESYMKSAQRPPGKAGDMVAILFQVFMFPQPEVLFVLTMYQGACTVSARALVAAVALKDWAAFTFALIYFLVFPIGWFAFVYYQMMVVLPKKNAAKFDSKTRNWEEIKQSDAPSDYVAKFGKIFTAYRGIRLAQLFVMLTMSQMLLVGMCTGFLTRPAVSGMQSFFVTLFANVGFVAFSWLRPLVHSSMLKSHIYNVESVIKTGMAALTLLLITVGPALSSMDGASEDVTESAMSRIPDAWINRGVMACSLVGLLFSMAVLVWDMGDSVWEAVQVAMDARKHLKVDEGLAAAAKDSVSNGPRDIVKTKRSKKVVV
jgi:hypothetical protein